MPSLARSLMKHRIIGVAVFAAITTADDNCEAELFKDKFASFIHVTFSQIGSLLKLSQNIHGQNEMHPSPFFLLV